MILPADARAYVVVGTVDVRIPIPPGRTVVGLACGLPPKRIGAAIGVYDESVELTIEAVEWDTLSAAAMAALPAVLLVVSRDEADGIIALSQDSADALHADVVCDWARCTSAGFA
jgi:hypothetical protein